MTRYRDDRFDRFDDRDDRYSRERQSSTGRYGDPRQYENHDERQLHGFDRQGFEQSHSDAYGRPYRPDPYRQQQGYSQDDARSYGGRPSDSRYGVNADRSGMGYSDLMDYDRGYSYDDRPQYGQRDFRRDGMQGQGRYPGGYGQSAYSQGSQYGNDQHYDWEGLRHASQRGQQSYGQGRQYGYGQAEYDAPQFGDSDFRSSQYQGGQYGTRSFSQSSFGQSQYGQPSYQSQGSQYGYGQTHQGKGPKGYQRSDDRIKEQVNDALEEAHDVDASEIDVQVMNGEVTLTGTVSDRMQKRRAEETVEYLRGVKDVHNQLRVQQGQYGQSGSQVLSSGLNSQSVSQQQGGNLGGSSMSSVGNQSTGTAGSSVTGTTGTTTTSSDNTKR